MMYIVIVFANGNEIPFKADMAKWNFLDPASVQVYRNNELIAEFLGTHVAGWYKEA